MTVVSSDPLNLAWTLWAFLWLVTAAWSARSVAREALHSRLAVSVLLAIGFYLLLASNRLPARFAPRFVPVGLIWQRIGLALTISGLGFAVWARIHLGRYWSGRVTLKEDHKLIRSGPYAFVRHPIYTGLLTAGIGTVLARGTLAALVGLALMSVAFWMKIRAEENLLTNHFGDTYREYRREVAALIPFLIFHDTIARR